MHISFSEGKWIIYCNLEKHGCASYFNVIHQGAILLCISAFRIRAHPQSIIGFMTALEERKGCKITVGFALRSWNVHAIRFWICTNMHCIAITGWQWDQSFQTKSKGYQTLSFIALLLFEESLEKVRIRKSGQNTHNSGCELNDWWLNSEILPLGSFEWTAGGLMNRKQHVKGFPYLPQRCMWRLLDKGKIIALLH